MILTGVRPGAGRVPQPRRQQGEGGITEVTAVPAVRGRAALLLLLGLRGLARGGVAVGGVRHPRVRGVHSST